MKTFFLVVLSLLLYTSAAEIYAVLIAGSNVYYNYRHQADLCHAYHVLLNHGVKPDNIITMAYDDMANNTMNPFKGKLFNKPDGEDVYAGCVLDYTGDEVTPQNFIGVLTGNKTATKGKKVLNSTTDDEVFINFVDHGATGLVAIINEYLYADQLINALKIMHSRKMYHKLLFYMEACESGSMFTNLPDNISVLAHTAANPDESSFACHCYPDNYVNETSVGSCLGDTWSVSWMEDSDAKDLSSITIKDQYKSVLAFVTQSHPQIYGNVSMLKDYVSAYQGDKKPINYATSWILHRLGRKDKGHQVDTRMSKLHHVETQFKRNKTFENYKNYRAEVDSIEFFDSVFQKIDLKIGQRPGLLLEQSIRLPEDLSCLRSAVQAFESECVKFSDYGLKYTRNLAHLCYTYHFTNFEDLFKEVCNTPMKPLFE